MHFYQTPFKLIYFARLMYYKYLFNLRVLKVLYQSDIANLRPKFLGLLCYSLGWITGIIVLKMKKIDSFVCFHAWQSILTCGMLSIVLTVPIVVMKFITLTSFTLAWFLVSLYWLILLFTVYLWILLMFKAYQGQAFKLYIVGDIAWNLSGEGNTSALNNTESRFSVAVLQDKPPTVGLPGLEKGNSKRPELSLGILNETVNSIALLYENRDPYTASHQQRVSHLACAIARKMGLPDERIEGIRIIGRIHDIGKIAVPGETLSKTGKLNSYEMGIIKTHPEVAFNVIKGLVFPWPVARAIFQHHERLNGSGYPKGLSGEEILLESRILSVSDVVEAMATHRPYRPSLGIEKALNEIASKRGVLYDPAVVDACLNLFNEGQLKFE